MQKFLPTFAAFAVAVAFASSAARAQDPSARERGEEPTVEEMKAWCTEKYPASAAARAECVSSLRHALADERHGAVLSRLDAGETRDREIVAALDAGKSRDEEILTEVRTLSGRVDGLARDLAEPAARAPVAPAPAPEPAPAAAAAPAAQPAVYAPTGGTAAWAPVPHAAWASIHNLESMVADTRHIRDLGSRSARERCGGLGATMVMLTDHGLNITNVWAPPGAATSGFTEVYFDADGDGMPEGGTVFALDLQTQDDVWVSWGRREDIRLVYLRPSGQVAVQGLGYRTLYRPTVRSDNPASGAVACGMDVLDPKSGHYSKSAGSMSQAW